MPVNYRKNAIRDTVRLHRDPPDKSPVFAPDPDERHRGRHSDSTQSRLLDAAEHWFAEKGFEQTSVRDLTAAAGCNVASVNYHFGSKENLYTEMFRRLLVEMRERRIAAVRESLAQPKPTLESVLRGFAVAFTEPLAGESRGRRLVQLYIRETASPILPQGMFYEELIHPSRQIMSEALDIVCPGLAEPLKYQCMHSLVAQLIHLFQSRSVLETGDPANSPMLDYQGTLDHIIRFTAVGIRHMQRQGKDVR